MSGLATRDARKGKPAGAGNGAPGDGRVSDHLQQFRQRGYAVIKGVFDADEVAALRAAFDRVYATGLRHPTSYRHQNVYYRIGQDPALGRVLRLVQWPSYFDPTLAAIRTDRRLFDIVAPILGRDIKQIINQMHWKPPGAAVSEFGYHQDIRFRRPREAYRNPARSYVQTGIAIDPHRRDNGAMTFLPGSHDRGEVTLPGRGPIMNSPLSDADLAAAGLDACGREDLILEPGDVGIWSLFTVHGSHPNRSTIDRRVYLNGYVRAADCDRGEWAFRDGRPCVLGQPALVHYDDLYTRPEPHYVTE